MLVNAFCMDLLDAALKDAGFTSHRPLHYLQCTRPSHLGKTYHFLQVAIPVANTHMRWAMLGHVLGLFEWPWFDSYVNRPEDFEHNAYLRLEGVEGLAYQQVGVRELIYTHLDNGVTWHVGDVWPRKAWTFCAASTRVWAPDPARKDRPFSRTALAIHKLGLAGEVAPGFSGARDLSEVLGRLLYGFEE